MLKKFTNENANLKLKYQISDFHFIKITECPLTINIDAIYKINTNKKKSYLTTTIKNTDTKKFQRT